MTATANQLEVRAAEIITLRCVLPRMWKPRLWVCARLMWLAAWIAGMDCTVELAAKK